MGRGMSLEEFRNALSSDATVENEKLKTELKDLKEKLEAEIAELKGKSEQYEQWCKQLGRRCFVQTCGTMCVSCGVTCCDYALTCPSCKYEVARNDDYTEMRPKHCPECGTKLKY